MAQANYKAAIHPEKLNTYFNVGFGSTLSILDLAKMIDGENFEFIPVREGEAEIAFADTSKLETVLGWKPGMSIQNYIAEEIGVAN